MMLPEVVCLLPLLVGKEKIGGQRPVGGENSSIDLQDNIFMTRTPNIAFLVGYPWVPFLG